MSNAFHARSQTFGLDTPDSWALPALRLLYCAPRIFEPLVLAWEKSFPGTMRALERMQLEGFVTYQGPIIVDTRTQAVASRASRKVKRYRITSAGRRMADQARLDIRTLQDAYPRMAAASSCGILALLDSFNLTDGATRYGRSVAHALTLTELPESVAKWWIYRWVDDGILRELPHKIADVREVVPAHYRPRKTLSTQLSHVLANFTNYPGLAAELNIGRRNYLDHIDPARIGVTGATDYDHDVECQRILATLLSSPRAEPAGYLWIEPRLTLPIRESSRPYTFHPAGQDVCFYQPDAEMREYTAEQTVRRSILEYERFQTRRDAWNHIERFLGYLQLRTLASEHAVLRFIVDTPARERGYVALIEAFADYALDHPERMPANQVTLAVTHAPRLQESSDPLADGAWHTVRLACRPVGADPDLSRTVLHSADDSPYDDYFGTA